MLIPGSQWVLASVYAGSGGIRLINVRDHSTSVVFPTAVASEKPDTKTYSTCPGAPDAAEKAKFVTHGLALRAGRNSIHTLLAVHHGNRESIELFEVAAGGKVPTLTWIGCVIAPDPIGLNSVVALTDGGFIATDFAARGPDAQAAFARMLKGEINGALWEWHPTSGWTKIPGSEAAGANGVEISRDGKWLYVAEWGKQAFFRISRGQTPVKRDSIQLGFRVDNLRWSSDGLLLYATGQAAAPEQISHVVKIDPNTLKVEAITQWRDTNEFQAGTVALQIGKELWVGSFRSDRIAIFPMP